jgi:hypothetical protein
MTVALSNLSATWAASNTTVNTAIRMNVTDTLSASNSKLIDLLVANTSKFAVDKSGNVSALGLTVDYIYANTINVINTVVINETEINVVSNLVTANVITTSNLILGGANTITWLQSISGQANSARDSVNSSYTQANTARTIVLDTGNSTRYLMLANGTSGTSTLNVSSGLTYNPSTNTLFVANNVGIGVAPTLGNLHVSGTAYASSGFVLPNGDSLYWGVGDGSAAVSGNSVSNYVELITSGTSRFVVDSVGQISHYGTGLASFSNVGYVPQYALYSANNTAGSASYFLGYRSRGSIVSPSAVSNGDTLGNIFWGGYDGNSYELAAGITAYVSTTPGNNDMPGALAFLTTPNASTAPTTRMIIDHNGYALIGYASSQGAYSLQVNSQIFATSATIATSDGKYKANVVPLTNALSIVTKLNPVQFEWKQHPVHNFDRAQPTVGFIAQEVEQVLANQPYVNAIVKKNICTIEPEERDADGNVTKEAVKEEFAGIAEGNMIAILTKAIQEQQKIIENLTSRLEKLENP